MKDIKEHSLVIVDDKIGTVVYIYPGNEIYEVEFETTAGENYVKTVKKEQIKLLK
jgi:hypothetical protein